MLAAIAVGIAAFVLGDPFAPPPIPFERTAWDASRESLTDQTRHRMADSLIESKAPIGKSAAEVTLLLGEPDTPTFHPEIWDITYVLGPCRHMMSIDTEFLVLKLDANRIVREAGLTED